MQVTDLDARFVFDMLPAAEYVVPFTLPGFEPREMRVAVESGAAVSLDVVLKIARPLADRHCQGGVQPTPRQHQSDLGEKAGEQGGARQRSSAAERAGS